jgi:RNA polymerase sigma factor (sigma-70 family)
LNIDDNVSERLRNRSSKAIDDLILWYEPLLREMADRQLDVALRRKVGVSDIVQEACTDVVRGFESLKAVNRFQFYAYLRTVMHNTLEDARRRFKRTGKRRICNEVTLGYSHAANLPEELNAQPIDKMISDENFHQLRTVLSKLPRELQRLLRWRFRKQMTYKEIGEKLNRSEDDVRMLIKRCLARIRPEISRDGSSQ